MFCNQCEQALQGTGCDRSPGVCGKDADVQSLQEILLYGVKGLAAYAHHARRLGKTDPVIDEFVERAIFSTLTNVNFDVPALLDLCLECGEKNLAAMALLDAAHREAFGAPSPAAVKEGTVAGPGILVTGHDLKVLADLLAACEGTDVRVYTHGEMLPAHMYPKLREHPNLAGHYGGAWQKQRRQFSDFPGAILANTNCIVPAWDGYRDRVYTTPPVAIPGAKILADGDYAQVVRHALALPPCEDAPVRESTIGFHHAVIAEQVPALLDAVQKGEVRRFFLVGGCDGAEAERDYFARYAKAIPEDCFVLTLGCGKYRIREHEYGTLLGLPRLLDMGQCNDAYGAVQVAVALAEAAGCTVNDLPLTMVVSWFEQKAVAVLLTLLHLGVRGVTIGPRPPAFVSPGILEVLQQRWDLRFTGADPEGECAAVLAA